MSKDQRTEQLKGKSQCEAKEEEKKSVSTQSMKGIGKQREMKYCRCAVF